MLDKDLVVSITEDGETWLENDLEHLVNQLSLLGADFRVERRSAEGVTKGADIIIAVGLSASALRVIGKVLSPMITAWITRPRKHSVSVTIGAGSDRRKIEFSSEGASQRQFAQHLNQVAEFIEAATGDLDE